MFKAEITHELKKKLSPKHVKTRKQANFSLSYVEGWHVIAEMNRIFGHDGWSRITEYCKKTCEYKLSSGNHKVGYEAKVIITVGDVVREGTGAGSGISRDLFDAYEGAAKEAETDAMKRACMTFGNPFGLALYDKDQANVGVDITSDERTAAAIARFNTMKTEEQITGAMHTDSFISFYEAITDENRKQFDDAINAKLKKLEEAGDE